MKKYLGNQTGKSIDENVELAKTSLQDIIIKTKIESNDSNDNFIVDVDSKETNNIKEIELIFKIPSNNDEDDKIIVDDELSLISSNPVQNKVITKELNKKGTYSKPILGIPKSDLHIDVQNALNKADSALQSYEEQYTGTVTGIKMNGVSKGTSGIIDLGTVITEHQDISNLATKSEVSAVESKIPLIEGLATETYVNEKIEAIEYPTVDLTGYATEEWVEDKGYLTEHQDISGKQDIISDLEEIRAGAALGATALQEHQDISGKVDKIEGKQLSTEDFTTILKQKLDSLSNYDDTDINNSITSLQTQLNTLLSGNADDAINSFNEIIAFLEGIEDSENLDNIIASIEQQIAAKQDKMIIDDELSLTSINPIQNKIITEKINEKGTYSKPNTGIPKNDLSSYVQTSLDKADTALQSYTETDPIFKASAAYNIKTNDITNWDNKISGDSTITKIVKVSSLPSSPDSNTLYIIV